MAYPLCRRLLLLLILCCGASGAAGMTAGQGSGGNVGPGREPEPGEVYGSCLDDGSCDPGLWCISDSTSGAPMSYCTTSCGALGGMRCPQTRDGRSATCVLGICVR